MITAIAEKGGSPFTFLFNFLALTPALPTSLYFVGFLLSMYRLKNDVAPN